MRTDGQPTDRKTLLTTHFISHVFLQNLEGTIIGTAHDQRWSASSRSSSVAFSNVKVGLGGPLKAQNDGQGRSGAAAHEVRHTAPRSRGC